VIANSPTAWDARAHAQWSWQASLWSQRGQQRRFATVANALNVQPHETILDFGCGTGRLRQFIEGHYYGFDWSPAMRERARADQAGYDAVILDELAADYRFDHVVCIGTFNLKADWSKAQTWDTLKDLWKHVERTLTVCLYRGDDPDCLSYAPGEALAFSLSFTKRYILDTTYLPNDSMLVMIK